MFQFSHASGLSQPSKSVRGKERGRCPGMEEFGAPWNLGSSAGEAVLREAGWSLQGPHCRNLSVGVLEVVGGGGKMGEGRGKG